MRISVDLESTGREFPTSVDAPNIYESVVDADDHFRRHILLFHFLFLRHLVVFLLDTLSLDLYALFRHLLFCLPLFLSPFSFLLSLFFYVVVVIAEIASY